MFAKQTVLVALCAALSTAHADPDNQGRFEIGAGFSSDDGFIARAAVDQPNLFGTGDDLGLIATISARRQLFVLHAMDPRLFGSDLSLGDDLYSDMHQLPGFWRKAVGTTVTASAPITAHVRAWVGYRLEDVSVERDTIARTIGTPPPDAAGLVSALRAGMTYSTLDSWLYPTRGSELGASLEHSDRRLGSDFDVTRAQIWASTHQPIGPFVVHLGGSLTQLASPDEIPLSERLYLDGSRDIRGYLPGAWGPLDGGTTKLTGRASLELRLSDSFSLEGFLDGARIDDASHASTGFGLVWRSPLGPIALDLAFPFGGKPMLVFNML